MASSLQRPALRATVALLRSTPKASDTAAGAGASLRASLTTAATATCRAKSSLAAKVPIAPAARPLAVAWTTRRAFSSDAPAQSKIYSFEDVKKLTETPKSPVVIIDTREPAEVKDTGHIPGAINIPVSSQPDAFFIPDDDFEDRFGFHRPDKDTEMLFYCKAGVRSRAAAQLAREAGWTKTYEYPGSWNDWAGKGGPVQR